MPDKSSENYKKVPVALFGETQVNDSMGIVKHAQETFPGAQEKLPLTLDDPEVHNTALTSSGLL